ncbi:HAD family hydrolase [Aquibacillus koreensis]|uniref:HAD family hydrolase n=1 Tax=Aquibacillus koreensis TaxID=279446 RepID=A0A9X4AI83_9BACI|nr:HAD family hydrolase [Aquibacillus koreensis]MCT2534239.1 HAD family hydrolase [Aquibacillus koreensis]MDC3420716.1 HAD family hydrolase [Aquibacillus koreensis]
MIQSVLFDLDGTLLDRDSSVLHFIHNQYDRLYQHFPHVQKESFTQRFVKLDDGGYVWKDKVYQQLAQEFSITSISWNEFLHDYLQHFKFSCKGFDGLHKMLSELLRRDIKMGIITNGFTDFQLGNIEALDITSYFQSILVSEQEGVRKPEPAIFKRALSRMQTDPSQSVFVGDHPVNDIKAAKDLGMTSVWVNNKHFSEIAEADYTIDNLLELPSLITHLNTSKLG